MLRARAAAGWLPRLCCGSRGGMAFTSPSNSHCTMCQLFCPLVGAGGTASCVSCVPGAASRHSSHSWRQKERLAVVDGFPMHDTTVSGAEAARPCGAFVHTHHKPFLLKSVDPLPTPTPHLIVQDHWRRASSGSLSLHGTQEPHQYCGSFILLHTLNRSPPFIRSGINVMPGQVVLPKAIPHSIAMRHV